jgi:hypothetical protein
MAIEGDASDRQCSTLTPASSRLSIPGRRVAVGLIALVS